MFTIFTIIGFLICRLSGLSPFAGDNDVQTLKNVKACDWDFDLESFKYISEEGKDFIRKLLVANKEKRMTAHECLLHPWLTGDHSGYTQALNRERYLAYREKLRKNMKISRDIYYQLEGYPNTLHFVNY